MGFQEQYQVNPIAIYSGDRGYLAGLNDVRLNMGNAILLQGPWDRFHIIRNQPQPRALTFASPLEGEILRPEKAKWALFWLALALSQIIFFKIKRSVALMSGAPGMIITGVLSVDETYHSVDCITVFIWGGLIPLRIALEQTGTAAFMTKSVLDSIGQVSPVVLLGVIGIMTSIFALVISNVGTTLLLVPLCMNVALMAGGDPWTAAMVVGLSVSDTFALPTYQVNALIRDPADIEPLTVRRRGQL